MGGYQCEPDVEMNAEDSHNDVCEGITEDDIHERHFRDDLGPRRCPSVFQGFKPHHDERISFEDEVWDPGHQLSVMRRRIVCMPQRALPESIQKIDPSDKDAEK